MSAIRSQRSSEKNSITRLSLNMKRQKNRSNEKARENAEKKQGNPDKDREKEANPFAN